MGSLRSIRTGDRHHPEGIVVLHSAGWSLRMSTPEELPFIHFRSVREPAIAALTALCISVDHALVSKRMTIQGRGVSHRCLAGTCGGLLLLCAARGKKAEKQKNAYRDDHYPLHCSLSVPGIIIRILTFCDPPGLS